MLIGVIAGQLQRVFDAFSKPKTAEELRAKIRAENADTVAEIEQNMRAFFEKLEEERYPDPIERQARRAKRERENAEYIASGKSCFHNAEKRKPVI